MEAARLDVDRRGCRGDFDRSIERPIDRSMGTWIALQIEIETPYGERPEGSVSKLRTYRDGWRILMTITSLFREERPLAFFAIAAGGLASIGILLAVPLAITYVQTGPVPLLPTAVLATGFVLLASPSMVCVLVLDTVTRGRREMRRLAYLALAAPQRALGRTGTGQAR